MKSGCPHVNYRRWQMDWFDKWRMPEGDALRKARQVMGDNKPMTVTYDTRESNQNLGIGWDATVSLTFY